MHRVDVMRISQPNGGGPSAAPFASAVVIAAEGHSTLSCTCVGQRNKNSSQTCGVPPSEGQARVGEVPSALVVFRDRISLAARAEEGARADGIGADRFLFERRRLCNWRRCRGGSRGRGSRHFREVMWTSDGFGSTWAALGGGRISGLGVG